ESACVRDENGKVVRRSDNFNKPGECCAMILPTKHVSQDRALLTIGAGILRRLSHPLTVSALWEGISSASMNEDDAFKEKITGFDLRDDVLPTVLTDAQEDGGLFGIGIRF